MQLYCVGNFASRLLSAVMQCWVWSVLGWVIACEHFLSLVVSSFFLALALFVLKYYQSFLWHLVKFSFRCAFIYCAGALSPGVSECQDFCSGFFSFGQESVAHSSSVSSQR